MGQLVRILSFQVGYVKGMMIWSLDAVLKPFKGAEVLLRGMSLTIGLL